jgi:hypothetical protein
MKKILIAFCLLIISVKGFTQTCEQREAKLLETLGSFSAGFLYNTYGMIGGIVDGYANNAYTAEKANTLVDEQKKITDNLAKVLDELNTGNFLNDKSDQDYVTTAINILKGLKSQIRFFQDYVKTKSTQSQDQYEQQRQKNWKDISKLMGIDQ